ncbi:MAG: LysR family transcriptional regulator [Lachnospiraceae bacterium]|nr:LysR family transcriptional regulator [Lachnospiraceae bacterium]
MNIRELSGFVKIVELGSFSLASESLYISQSALSQQIKSLEHSIGFDLFEHGQRRVKLTQAGEQFYFHTKSILELYQNALEEGLALSQTDTRQIKYFQVGCLGDQYIRYWLELLRISSDIRQNYMPRFVRYENQAALLTALLKGEVDLTLQMESADIQSCRLNFIPLTSVREVCHFNPVNPSAELPARRILSVEDLFPYTLAFHNVPGKTLFEDSLRSYIRMHSPQTKILNPQDFYMADYAKQILLLVPSPQFTNQMGTHDAFLDFENNIRVGFITSLDCKPQALEYINYICSFYAKAEKIWDFSTF